MPGAGGEMKPNSFLERAAWAVLCLLVFSLPMEKGIQFPHLGTISRLLGQAAFVVGVAAVVRRGKLRKPNAALPPSRRSRTTKLST